MKLTTATAIIASALRGIVKAEEKVASQQSTSHSHDKMVGFEQVSISVYARITTCDMHYDVKYT